MNIKNKLNQAGQSLVETALFLPFLIILLAGVVEVSNILVTSNRVTTAARAATGFAANNIATDEWTSGTTWADSMANIAQQTVVDTLDADTERWDLWAVKATVNDTGDGFSQWIVAHPIAGNQIMSDDDWAANEADLKAELLQQLNAEATDPSGLEVVATVAYHNAESILGLSALENFAGLNAVRGLSVMRVNTPLAYGACNLFPISLNFSNRSLYPEGSTGVQADAIVYDSGAWDHPAAGATYSVADASGFPLNVPYQSVADARPGYIFEAREHDGSLTPGNFGWLSWDGQADAVALENSLRYPGNLTMQVPAPAGYVNYVNPDDASDNMPNVGDWVQGSTGNMNSNDIRNVLQGYNALDGQILQIVVFDQIRGQGNNFDYRIGGFALVKLQAYKNTANDKRILLQFQGWANDLCINPES